VLFGERAKARKGEGICKRAFVPITINRKNTGKERTKRAVQIRGKGGDNRGRDHALTQGTATSGEENLKPSCPLVQLEKAGFNTVTFHVLGGRLHKASTSKKRFGVHWKKLPDDRPNSSHKSICLWFTPMGVSA